MVWAIAPDDPAKLEALHRDQGLAFPLLVDDGTAMRAYGIVNGEFPKVPHPTAVVVDKAGIVRYVRVDVDYKVRPPSAELLEALRALP